jgi:hypothetical protein
VSSCGIPNMTEPMTVMVAVRPARVPRPEASVRELPARLRVLSSVSGAGGGSRLAVARDVAEVRQA